MRGDVCTSQVATVLVAVVPGCYVASACLFFTAGRILRRTARGTSALN
jgi:hypothetical protein